ncbi:unnamed protein product [Fusarium graminearum]|uniref:Chromosome 3, complete genome n=1 Tax=Gibberella zeae (strain ATCC MYA-4620 / CBS 123657 / FGSC 9075 / NRRL 31084 / PH-1) TaxID=229533 RepID=I1SAM1_GIBZE|nr:hypothetical protein FGSG_13902 [Fusarium graminearum PH-1]ESU17898.1 hypothetical protein FGSG_13902 [Fusarium graminearum PH-1]EYB34145.1 hypothetical protein FG05_13902 [Fusarium graminearum]CEF85955.1 unnamed protein product [Fusarium graminearum]CZS85429.1 unnamed protein product [Fusarium graminearum]|eukprot:XP_011325520.1 hypothetical protein FGSG_13902 [Fusarium graminearum PH-1]
MASFRTASPSQEPGQDPRKPRQIRGSKRAPRLCQRPKTPLSTSPALRLTRKRMGIRIVLDKSSSHMPKQLSTSVTTYRDRDEDEDGDTLSHMAGYLCYSPTGLINNSMLGHERQILPYQ